MNRRDTLAVKIEIWYHFCCQKHDFLFLQNDLDIDAWAGNFANREKINYETILADGVFSHDGLWRITF
jgi:hypothetical protein